MRKFVPAIVSLAIFAFSTVSKAEVVETSSLAPTRPDYIFDHYSTDNGLPHNSICDIHQDKKGYIWVGTWYGLSRFDGARFINYTLSSGEYDGALHNRMLSVDEDVNGYLWLRTYDYRIARFDPVNEVFSTTPDELDILRNDDTKITAFHLDRQGNAWVALYAKGLYCIAPDMTAQKIPESGSETTQDEVFWNGTDAVGNEVTGIYEDSKGTIYVVSELGIASVRDGTTTLLCKLPKINAFCEFGSKVYAVGLDKLVSIGCASSAVDVLTLPSEVTSMTVTGQNDSRSLYIGLNDGAIASVDTTALTIDVKNYDMGRVRYLFPDSEGLLWIATDRTGIYSFNSRTSRFHRYQHSRNVPSYYTDTVPNVIERAGLTWVKMNDYGFGWYDRQRDVIVPLHNVKDQEDCRFMNGVPCFEVDSTGVLWMSTTQRGLERVSIITPSVDIIAPPAESVENPASYEIRAIRKDREGNVWVAAKSRELYCYNSDMTSCTRVPEDIGVIYTIFEDRDGNIWLGTKGDGLVKMSRKSGQHYTLTRFCHDSSDPFSISSDNIYSIEQDNEGKLWIGTFGGGISMLQSADSDNFCNVYNNFPNYPLDYGERVRYLLNVPGGMLLATVGGLFFFDPYSNPQTMTFQATHQTALGKNDIIHIFSDNQGRIFLSTIGGGLYRIKVGEKGIEVLDAIDMSKGLASNILFSAAEDKYGDIWIATARGISKADHRTGTVTNYARYDGIIPTSFSEATCEVLDDGSVLFGSFNNIYRIKPESFKYAPEPSRLEISGISINGQRVPMSGGKVIIPHDYSFFRVDYASLNFRIRGSLNYSYMLKGYERDWISNASGQSVTYSRIPAGRYQFIVMVSPEDGTSGAEMASIDIRVRSSIWTSAVAKIIYVLVALAICFILLRMIHTSTQLRNSIQVEKDLNDVKMRFFTNISHEFRTPLTLILGGIDDISKNIPQGDRNEYSVSLVQKNANRMMLLVNQLLDIRSIAGGKMRLKVSQIDIVELLREVYNDFRDMASERGMEMRLTYSVDSLIIWGDRIRLEALIYNLLSNAFKYTADGGCIEVAIFWREGEKEFSIMVKDNGIGVPKERQQAIFEPFIKAADATFNGMNSSGIGLSFCKDITDMHSGRIWVKSEKNQGSEFWVRLPIDRDHFSEETAEFMEANAEEEIRQESVYGLDKYRVEPTHPQDAPKLLVVDDNAELRVYIYNNLVNRFDVKDVSNGIEALEAITADWIPDMIVTDYMMPQMDGIELINTIRSNFDTSHIPIIMFTAKHETDTHLKAMKYGADGYIAKPFTMELLVARIDNLLERRTQIVQNMARGTQGEKKVLSLAPDEVVITDKDENLIKKVHQWLEENVADSEITVDQLASYVGMGRTSMYNKIKGLTGKSPVELIQEFRLEKAMFYLKSGQYSVSETSYKVGFSDPGYFSRSFKKHCGISPADYIKKFKNKG